MRADGRLHQGGVKGWHAAEKIDLEMFDNFPETRDHPVAAISLRGCQHYMGAFRKRNQSRHEHTIDVEQGKSAKKRFPWPDYVAEKRGRAPGIGDLGSMMP